MAWSTADEEYLINSVRASWRAFEDMIKEDAAKDTALSQLYKDLS